MPPAAKSRIDVSPLIQLLREAAAWPSARTRRALFDKKWDEKSRPDLEGRRVSEQASMRGDSHIVATLSLEDSRVRVRDERVFSMVGNVSIVSRMFSIAFEMRFPRRIDKSPSVWYM